MLEVAGSKPAVDILSFFVVERSNFNMGTVQLLEVGLMRRQDNGRQVKTA